MHDPVDAALRGLDRVLDTVHDKVVRPLLLVTRYLAFGFGLLLLSLVLFVVTVIGLVRFGTTYLFDHHVWLTYLVVGSLSLLGGLLIWRRRRPVTARKK